MLQSQDTHVPFVDLRYLSDGILKTQFPCWSWQEGVPKSTPLLLRCVLAYAANLKLASQPYDGNIGLGVPRYVVVSLFVPFSLC